VIEAIRLCKGELKVPFIGFCGGPFTVASYFVGGVDEAKKWLYADPISFGKLLDKIEQVTIAYLSMQTEAGADVIQIFDSWANALTEEQFKELCLPSYRRILDTLKTPSILFMRGGGAHLEALSTLPSTISLDWQTPLHEARKKTSRPLQGNLDPDLLFAPLPFIRKKTAELLSSMKNDPAFILNLGHGIKPGTPVEAVQCLIETVGSDG
jgi:uroporphyrinogen decarboxylase